MAGVKLIEGAVQDSAFRRIVQPGGITGPALAERLREARRALVEYLDRPDPDAPAPAVRRAAETELECAT